MSNPTASRRILKPTKTFPIRSYTSTLSPDGHHVVTLTEQRGSKCRPFESVYHVECVTDSPDDALRYLLAKQTGEPGVYEVDFRHTTRRCQCQGHTSGYECRHVQLIQSMLAEGDFDRMPWDTITAEDIEDAGYDFGTPRRQLTRQLLGCE